MNNPYQELFSAVVTGLVKNGFEISLQTSWMVTLTKWKLVHTTEDLKVVECIVNVFMDNEDEPTQIISRFSYVERE
jgi:hypothetical protein